MLFVANDAKLVEELIKPTNFSSDDANYFIIRDKQINPGSYTLRTGEELFVSNTGEVTQRGCALCKACFRQGCVCTSACHDGGVYNHLIHICGILEEFKTDICVT